MVRCRHNCSYKSQPRAAQDISFDPLSPALSLMTGLNDFRGLFQPRGFLDTQLPDNLCFQPILCSCWSRLQVPHIAVGFHLLMMKILCECAEEWALVNE